MPTVKNTEECPECKGEKGYNKLLTPEWLEPSEYEWQNCQTCEGEGEITSLQLAVYKARGGPAPIKFRGYA